MKVWSYFDTDSIIYIDDRLKSIKTGDMLGDELSGNQSLSSFRQDQNLIVSNMVIMSKYQLLRVLP